MDYKHWCKFLKPETLLDWETEVILQMALKGRDFISDDFNNFSSFINNTLEWSATKNRKCWEDLYETRIDDLVDYSEEQKEFYY